MPETERVNPYLAHAASKPPAPRDGGGGDAPKVTAILKKEGRVGGSRRRHDSAARCPVVGKITNKHLSSRVSGEGVVLKTSVDQEEDPGDRR